MKKRIIFSVFTIVVAAAVIAGGTMAWFSNSAETSDAVFTAGVVSIEAGGSVILSQNFDPEEAVYLYGATERTGDKSGLYEIDVKSGNTHMFYEIDLSELAVSDTYSPNGLAFDNENRRLYFSLINGSNSTLYFYDFKNKELVTAGQVNAVVYGATFWNGYFWFIKNNSDDLYKVTFNADGKVITSEKVADITEKLQNPKSFGFGDVVIDIRDGVLYGSSTETGNAFFSYDIDNEVYSEIASSGNVINLQIAFGSDGVLYGHSTKTKKWYSINHANGNTEELRTGDLIFNDLASGYISVWNPGDTEKLKYYVTNTGTKRIYLRAKLEGSWENSGLDDDMVKITLCPEYEGDWKEHGNGVFYYMHEIMPGGSVTLCAQVQLNGPDTDNDYQGETYTLTGVMEAIQATNDAPYLAEGWKLEENFYETND